MVHATRCQGKVILLNLLSEGATLFVVHVVVLDPLRGRATTNLPVQIRPQNWVDEPSWLTYRLRRVLRVLGKQW